MNSSDSETSSISSRVRSRDVVTDDGSDSTSYESRASTPDSSVPSSPALPAKPPPFVLQPFYPPSLEVEDTNRQCPPLPSVFPAVPYNETPRVTAASDAQTPDSWIKRSPELIRLTGKHPFNTEGPLSAVFDAGFLTPAHLHVVRNHGAVPQVTSPRAYEDWKFRVHGLVRDEVEFSIRDLAEKFQVRTLPVTIACAGNRRKEQNVVRKSLGFDWGSAGVSTALWTGVYLADILEYVKPIRPDAQHVIFEGADTTLPKGPYGTSQKLSWAANRERGMLIAWAMNGLPLEPDHGFPVRLVVPGQIGGRMVKWLTRIEVSAHESNHHLHYWDNKVLPMQLTPEQARNETKWWYDPKYIITELNVQSAIAKPAHGESLFMPSDDDTDPNPDVPGATYPVRGFAYAGGGRRVNRVEISLDDGHTWALAEVEYPEDRFRQVAFEHPVYGLIDMTDRDTCFCWCFWTMHIAIADLAKASVVTLRAMDESMNTQPRDMYLNPTSMLNNWWFRMAIRKETKADGLLLTFEHPAPVGKTSSPGWMERFKAEGKDFLNPVFEEKESSAGSSIAENRTAEPKVEVRLTRPEVTRKISPEELKAQDESKPWFVVHGEVYDASAYLNEHPGGADSILLVAGEDATEDFMAIHSVDAKKKLAEYHIGTLSGDLEGQAPATASSDPNAPFLDPKVWKAIKLTAIERINHDSLIYRFSFPDGLEEKLLGLPVGQHVFVRIKRKDTGEVVQRAYTPVSREGAKGSIDFLIKLYLPTAHWPEGGKMTVGFNLLQVGDTIDLKGPLGSFTWQGNGTASWRGNVRKVNEIGLVCGGSGITPILQVLRSIIHDTTDATQLYLISANKTERDILCREEIDGLLALHPQRLRVHYILSSLETLTSEWTHGRGRLVEKTMREYLPAPPSDDADVGKMVLSCGPPGMIDGLRAGLANCGWNVERDLVVF